MEATQTPRSLNFWLQFDARTEAQHERERGSLRRKHAFRSIIIGMVFYNLYNFTSALLMPDILWSAIAMRVAVVSPLTLGLAYMVLVVSPKLRELLLLSGMIGAFAIPVGLFWYSNAPWAVLTFGEFSLTLVFGNMLLALRFGHAAIFSAVASAFAILAAMTKASLDPGLGIALSLQFLTAATFALLANYIAERRRCMDYLTAIMADERAHAATQETAALNVLSRTDPLTGLPNRRAWDDAVDAAFARHGTLAVMMLDIDHFKRFNDSHGHQAGDACLREVSAELAAVASQKGAFAARFGGEEFVVLLDDTTEFEAARLCQIILQRIKALGIAQPDRADGANVVTVSIGLALRQAGKPTTIADVIRRADFALYQAKQNGRNQFCVDQDTDKSRTADLRS